MLPAGGPARPFGYGLTPRRRIPLAGLRSLNLTAEGTALAAIMPRIWVDKQTGIQVAMKSWWITGTLFGSNGIGVFVDVEIGEGV